MRPGSPRPRSATRSRRGTSAPRSATVTGGNRSRQSSKSSPGSSARSRSRHTGTQEPSNDRFCSITHGPERRRAASMVPFATDWAAQNARWFPDAPALEQLEDGRALTWKQVDDRVGRLAGALAEVTGVRKGDRVVVLAENDIRTIELQFA